MRRRACVLAIAGLVGALACSDSTGPRRVETIATHPDSAHLSPGEGLSFDVRILDQRGDELGAEWRSRVEWSIGNTEIASLDTAGGAVSVTALAEGATTLRGELGLEALSIPIYVRPPWLDSIAVEPSPVLMSSSYRRDVEVRAFDSSGAERPVAGLRVSWAVLDTTVARVPFAFGGTHQMRLFGQARLGPTALRGETRLVTTVNGLIVRTEVEVVPEPVGPLVAPVVTPVSSTGLEVVWREIGNADSGYRVHRSPTAEGPYEHVASTGQSGPFADSDTTHVDTGLSPSTEYFYRIAACNEHGCSEVLSPPGGATTLQPAGGTSESTSLSTHSRTNGLSNSIAPSSVLRLRIPRFSRASTDAATVEEVGSPKRRRAAVEKI